MNAIELMSIQAAVLYKLNDENRIVRVNERIQTAVPALFIGKTHDSIWPYFHAELPDPIVDQIRQTASESVNIMKLCRIVERFREVTDIWVGPAYQFQQGISGFSDSQVVLIEEANKHLLSRHFAQLMGELQNRTPVVGYIVDGAVGSLCCSARKSSRAAEASLETAAQYRGKGLALRVSAVWSKEVAKQGLIPLFSTSWDNLSSQKVAHKLGLVQYGVDFSISIRRWR